MTIVLRTTGLLAACVLLASCGLGRFFESAEKCRRSHQFEGPEARTDVDKLGKVVTFPARPVRAHWTKGPLEGKDGPIPGGDWELMALLEFSEEDAAVLAAEDITELTELEIPALPWMARLLGMPPPRTGPPNTCEEPRLRVSGFRYDGKAFERYFLKNKHFMKIPSTPYFILWLSTR
jgi:hypothetical protein